jgi:hypothetical protein
VASLEEARELGREGRENARSVGGSGSSTDAGGPVPGRGKVTGVGLRSSSVGRVIVATVQSASTAGKTVRRSGRVVT